MSELRFVGLDVHADTIAVAVAEEGGEARSLGTIPNRRESVRKMIRKLADGKKLRCCYEAGPTGYSSVLANDAMRSDRAVVALPRRGTE